MNLRPYQQIIAKYIEEHPRCNIYAPMGMGKTLSVLTALDRLDCLEDAFPALILAPLRVAQSTWPAEVRKWASLRHLRVSVIVGSAQARLRALRTDADIYTINYENVPWLVDTLNGCWPFPTVVADESTRLKGYRTKNGGVRTAALAKVAHHGDRFINLTGTPCANGLADTWGPQWFLDRGGRLGESYTAFRDRWFQPVRTGDNAFDIKYEPYRHAEREIKQRIADCTMSLRVEDYFDIKEPIVTPVEIELPERARRLYEAMEEDLYVELLEGSVEAFSAGSRAQKLLQLASGFIYLQDQDGNPTGGWEDVHDAKLDALESVVEETAGAPLLVSYQYKADLARITRKFPYAQILDKSPETIGLWNKGKIRMLLAHPKSAGHGLNLQDGGNILVYYGHDFDLEGRLQIAERIGPVRQAQAGYDRPVYHYHIIAQDTVEGYVLHRVRKKTTLVLDLLEYFNAKHREKHRRDQGHAARQPDSAG